MLCTALWCAIAPLASAGEMGSWAGPAIVDVGSTPSHIAIGDLDGDGKPDLVVATIEGSPKAGYRGAILVFHQKAGQYAAPPDRRFDLPVMASGLVVGDFDRDGAAELVVGLRTRRCVRLYLGGERWAKAHDCRNLNDSAGGGLSVGHINRQGMLDLVTGAVWRKWLGRERFRVGYFKGPVEHDNFSSRLVDLDGSGFDDVVFLTRGNQIRIYYGPFLAVGSVRAQDAFEVVSLTTPFAPGPRWAGLASGDLNGDGQPDIVTFRRKTKTGPAMTLVYYQNSPTGFTDGVGPSVAIEGTAGPLAIGDLNGDGLDDLAAWWAEAGAACVFLGRKGSPIPSTPGAADRAIRLPAMARSMAAGDMDLDGAADLVIGMVSGKAAIVASRTGR